jgi:hypothetical protein
VVEEGHVARVPWYQSLCRVRTFRPWLSIHATMNTLFLEKIRAKIVNWVFRHPGAHKSDIVHGCADFLSPPSLHEIIDAMEDGGLLRSEVMRFDYGIPDSEKMLLARVKKDKIVWDSSSYFITSKSTSTLLQ